MVGRACRHSVASSDAAPMSATLTEVHSHPATTRTRGPPYHCLPYNNALYLQRMADFHLHVSCAIPVPLLPPK